jgi:hypothetical protein
MLELSQASHRMNNHKARDEDMQIKDQHVSSRCTLQASGRTTSQAVVDTVYLSTIDVLDLLFKSSQPTIHLYPSISINHILYIYLSIYLWY